MRNLVAGKARIACADGWASVETGIMIESPSTSWDLPVEQIDVDTWLRVAAGHDSWSRFREQNA